MSRLPLPHRARLLGAVAAACAFGLASLMAVPPVGVAGAVREVPRLSVEGCSNTKGELAWAPLLSQASPRFGAPIDLDVTLLCVGFAPSASLTPVTGVPVSLSVSPSGVVSLRPPTRITTNADGTALAVLASVRAGTAQVRVEVSDGEVCARDFSALACQSTVTVTIDAHGGLVSTAKTQPAPPTQLIPPAPAPAPPKADGILPPRHPAQNAAFLVQVPPLGPCNGKGSTGSADPYDASVACAQYYVARINAARRQQGEHIAAMRLPTNWAQLSPDEQLFVTADLERIDRNLPPYVGLSQTLNAIAQTGAAHDEDPDPSSLELDASANWFPDVVSAAEADYGWMYSDGVGGNADCQAATDPGCWGHRYDILGRYTGLGCTDCVMGAGIAYPQGQLPDLTELFVEPSRPGQFPTYFTWAKDVVPYLKG